MGQLLDPNSDKIWEWLHLRKQDEPIWGGAPVPALLLHSPKEMQKKLCRLAVRTLLHAAMRAHKRAIEDVSSAVIEAEAE